jgi:hypothetical protein
VTVVPSGTSTLEEYTVTLGDQGDAESGFIDLHTSDVYTTSTAEDNNNIIDMFYYWGAAGESSLYSPQGAVDAGITSYANLGNWSERATTKFLKDNSAEYDNATYESVGSNASGAVAQGETNLSEGDLIYFLLDDGLAGLIKVGTIVPGKDGKGIDEITFTYKIQVPESY